MRVPTTVLWAALVLVASIASAQTTDRMFVTSATGNGNLSSWPAAEGRHGLEAANHICQKLAADAGLASAATFQAWLSDATTDAACNIKARGGHPPFCGSLLANNPGPWARTDAEATPFARNVATLTAGEVLSPPILDEKGHRVPLEDSVWTGTDRSGVETTEFACADDSGAAWTNVDELGTRGEVKYGNFFWTNHGALDCDTPAHLYCFQHTVLGGPPFDPFERDGALVFLTSRVYESELGRSPEAHGQVSRHAADEICRSRATAGGLPHPASFRAWISTSNFDAAEVLADVPLKRPDGIPIAGSKADFLDGELSAPITETELLTYGSAGGFVVSWTGTREDGTASGENCLEWIDTEDPTGGRGGLLGAITQWSDAPFPFSCESTLPLYCISNQPILFWTGFEEDRGPLWRWAGVGSD